MKKFLIINKLEKGQVIPLVVLMLFVIIGMVALIIDGGAVMSNRRTAQAAADAGALAGAQRACLGKTDAKSVAENYAKVNNNATSALATVLGKQVTVNATIEHPSFFSRIFGEDTLKAGAEAVAGCFSPDKAKSVLPIAFYYQSPPINAKDAVCITDGSCNLVSQDFKTLMDALRDTPVLTGTKINLPLDDIYIITDKTKICEKSVTGVIVCPEMSGLASGGNRTFLDFGDVLKDIIKDGLRITLDLPAWVNGKPGAVSSVYKPDNFITVTPPIVGYESVEARLYYTPVFDKYCSDCSSCEPKNDNKDYCTFNKDSYHLVGFAPFVVTCVQMNSECAYGACVPKGTWELGGNTVTVKSNKGICPGLLASDPLQENIGSSIEGYIVVNFPKNQNVWGTDGVDAGVYTISLTK